MQTKAKIVYNNIVSSSEELGLFVNKNPIMTQSINISNNTNHMRYTVEAKKHLPYIKQSFNAILEGLKNNESFLILPDYDADGTISGFLYYNLLILLRNVFKSTSSIQIKPTARDEGYGISAKFFESDLHKNIDNIITTDIGISIEFPMEFIESKKRIIIFDHHTPLSSIWFSVKEFKHFFLKKHQNADLTNRNIVDIKQLKEDLREFFADKVEFAKLFKERFFMNNYVLNLYPDYYTFFAEGLSIQNKNLDTSPIQLDYNKIFYSSAGQLAVSVYEYALEYLINNKLLNSGLKNIINYIGVGGAITSVSDVTDLSSCNNMYFFLQGQKVVNYLQKELNKKNLEPTSENIQKLILASLPLNLSETQDYPKVWIEQIGNFLSWVLSFKGKFSFSDLGFSICPAINSYGRVSLMHWLYLEWIKGSSGIIRENNLNFNEVRKQIQSNITKNVLEDIKSKKRDQQPIVIGAVQEVAEEDITEAYNDLKSFFATKHSDVFLDYITREVSDNEVEKIEAKIMENHEGVFGIIASKVVEMFKKPAFVGKYVGEKGFKGSWRSLFSLFDLGCTTFDSVDAMGGHAAAFGIALNDVEGFLAQLTEKLETFSVEELAKKYVIKMDLLLKVKPIVKDLLTYERFFTKFDGLSKTGMQLEGFDGYVFQSVNFMGKEGMTVKLSYQDVNNNEITFLIWDYAGFCQKYEIDLPQVDTIWEETEWKKQFVLSENDTQWVEKMSKLLFTEILTLSNIQSQWMKLKDEKYINVTFFVG